MHPTRRWLSRWARPLGDRRWDVLVRATAAVALLGIPTVIAFPRLVPLVWLAVVSIPANSPLSPILPTAFEPVIMEAAKHERAIWVSLVALGGYMYMEYLNWHAYTWVMSWKRFAPFKSRRWVQRSVEYFARSPFATVVCFAFAPFPFWVARCLAILHHYSLRQFMVATAVGRFPRLYLYAWVGERLRVPTVLLLGVIVAGAAAVIATRLARGQRVLADTAFDQEAAAPPSDQSDDDSRKAGAA